MDLEDAAILGMTNIDKSKIPPIQQKRILAFINHFIINTCTFLNNFAAQCESRFLEIERKLQKVEAALIILESKLASIDGVDNVANSKKDDIVALQNKGENSNDEPTAATSASEQKSDISKDDKSKEIQKTPKVPTPENGVKASEDIRYKKYFKMLQVGVPMGAVKTKMQAEGFDPSILENPNIILEDGIKEDTGT